MVKVKTKRQYCSPYSCKNKDKLALGLYVNNANVNIL